MPDLANASEGQRAPQSGRWPTALLWILVVGAIVRLALIGWFWNEPLYIGDEKEYNEIAVSLVETGRYASDSGELTSIRPPLYPALLATVYRLCGTENYNAVRLLQIALGLLNVVVVYALAQRMYDRQTAVWAAGLVCFYPSMLGYGNLLLTEIVFALLLCTACLTLHRFLSSRHVGLLAAFAVLLALAALTRSVLWLFPPFLVLFLLLAVREVSWPRRLGFSAVALIVFGLVLTPWTIRNTRLHDTFVTVDVMGGRNALMGNYEHTPLYRSWDAISISGNQSWSHVLRQELPPGAKLTQGQLDKAAMKRTVGYILENPGITTQRDIIKFLNFWQLERSLVAGLARGWWGDLPTAAILLVTAVIFSSYALALLSAVLGFTTTPPADQRMHWFLLLLVGFICAIHTVVFAHSRYHLGLMPLVLIYTARFWVNPQAVFAQWRSWRFGVGATIGSLLLASWVWEVAVVDFEKFSRQVLNG